VASSAILQVLTYLPTTELPNWQQNYDSGSVALNVFDLFHWLFRFIDDLMVINNNYLDKLLYTDHSFFEIHDICPFELLITLSMQENLVPI